MKPIAIKAEPDTEYPASTIPTMYFVGVTTAQSSSMRIFPKWAETLGLGTPNEVELVGVDCKIHDNPRTYRRIVEHVRNDPLTRGALVTTHKIDLLAASRDLFNSLTPHAAMMNEVSSIYKRDGKLMGHATDPIAGGRALEAILPPNHWTETGAEAFVLGAGGSSTAITSYLIDDAHGLNKPSRVVVSNRSAARLDAIRTVHETIGADVPIEYHHSPDANANDVLLAQLKPHSLVMNATGLGKDGPGSPLTDAAIFPRHGIAWDFNYRGDLVFLDQARKQADQQDLTIEDGWVYFVHGWLGVIADVFDIDIPTSGPEFHKLSNIASTLR